MEGLETASSVDSREKRLHVNAGNPLFLIIKNNHKEMNSDPSAMYIDYIFFFDLCVVAIC